MTPITFGYAPIGGTTVYVSKDGKANCKGRMIRLVPFPAHMLDAKWDFAMGMTMKVTSDGFGGEETYEWVEKPF